MQAKPKLPLHELLAVVIILAFMCFLITVTLYNRDSAPVEPTKAPLYVEPQEIEITILGAVENPGTYHLKKGDRIKDILELSKPLPHADLRKLKPETKLRDGRVIDVQEFPMLTIFLEGAIETEGPIQVRKGSTLKDLKNFVTFTEIADTEKLEKKRKLKDQETIKVPSKK